LPSGRRQCSHSLQRHAIPDATWGLHLTDASIALGNLVDIVRQQIAAYAKRGSI
jgi:hypothetical protein